MQNVSFVQFFRRYPLEIATAIVILLLCIKYLMPLFLFDVPLGYDAGIYRFLFLQYTDALLHFHLPNLDPWAQEHPLGVFVFAAPLIALGLSPDALIGGIWNLFPIVLLLVFATVLARKTGLASACALLVLGLLSQPFYDGFVAMYWKAYASLLFVILAYDAFDRRSWLFYVFAFMAVITHHQTGLIIALAVATWWLLSVRSGWKDPFWRQMTVLCGLLAVLTLAVYARQWERAFWSPLKSILLLRGDDAPGGAFPDTLFYVRTMAVTLVLGAYGFFLTVRKQLTLWHLSVVWCAVFIVFRLVFYRRFFLQLDFFLMPFGAQALVAVWSRYRTPLLRSLMILLLCAQAAISVQAVMLRRPVFSSVRLAEIRQLAKILPEDASVIALENQSGPWLLGWLPGRQIGAPGLFDFPNWSYEQWEGFLYGTNLQRETLLREMSGPVYFYLTPMFMQYYGDHIQGFLRDPCLHPVEGAPLLRSECQKNSPSSNLSP